MFSGMRLFPHVFLPVLLLCAAASGGQSPQDPSSKASQELQQWRASRATQLMDDFGELARYRNANAKLSPPAPGENRVVFLGDSITDSWDLVKYFPGKPYVNRGISGQTTPQMLVRFRQDVIDLQPRVVVILAGTNDIAGNTGPITLDQIEANYASMADLARAHKIRVVFSSVTPVNGYTEKAQRFSRLRSPQEILELNRWMKDYAFANGGIYLDYFDAMVDDDGFLKRTLSDDGLHPNDAGYKVMTPLAEKAIRQALGAASASVAH
jgi:lysophospholipase L1-like esterase